MLFDNIFTLQEEEHDPTWLHRLLSQLLVPDIAHEFYAEQNNCVNASKKTHPALGLALNHSFRSRTVLVLHFADSQAVQEVSRRLCKARGNQEPCIPNISGLVSITERKLASNVVPHDDVFLIRDMVISSSETLFSLNVVDYSPKYNLWLAVVGDSAMLGIHPDMRHGRLFSVTTLVRQLQILADEFENGLQPGLSCDELFVPVKALENTNVKTSESKNIESLFTTGYKIVKEINDQPCLIFQRLPNNYSYDIKLKFNNIKSAEKARSRIADAPCPIDIISSTEISFEGLCTGIIASDNIDYKSYVIVENVGECKNITSKAKKIYPSDLNNFIKDKTFYIRLNSDDNVFIVVKNMYRNDFVYVEREKFLQAMDNLIDIMKK